MQIPKWVEDVMPEIKNMTVIDYYTQYYNNDLIRLSAGFLFISLNFFLIK